MPEMRTEAALLEAISTQRDEAAFAELCKRYEKRAFSCAFHILHDPALAEDAVQEALLSIWLAAGSVQLAKGTVEAWLLRIVAYKSIDLLRKGRQRVARERDAARRAEGSSMAVVEDAERAEKIEALRGQLLRLLEQEGRMLALCYVAGLSHRTIAELLALPRRTVTERIQKALQGLRANMLKSGVSAAAPLATADQLREALSTCYDCPPGLTQRILDRIENTREETRPMGPGQALPAPRRTTAWRTVLLLGALVAGAAYLAPRPLPQDRAPQESSALPRSGPPATRAAATPAADPIRFSWDFQTPELKGLEVVMGRMEWRKGSAGARSSMELPSDQLTVWLYPPIPSGRSYVVTTDWRAIRHGTFTLGGGWFDGRGRLPSRSIFTLEERVGPAKDNSYNAPSLPLHTPRRLRYYAVDQFELLEYTGRIVHLSEYQRIPDGTMRRCQSGTLVTLEAIELRSLTDRELDEWRTKIRGLLAQYPRRGPWGIEPAWELKTPPRP